MQRAVRGPGHASFVDPRNAVGATPLMVAAAAGRHQVLTFTRVYSRKTNVIVCRRVRI